MPPLTTPIGYRYPTNVTMDHVRTFGSPRGEGGSGGYVFTPNVGDANGTAGSRAQGAAGGSAYVDSQVAARDLARGGNALLGAAGGAAYMDRVAASREIGRGGVPRTTPDGVSTHFAHLWSERQAAEAAAYRADWIASFQAAVGRRDNAERQIAAQRQDIIRTSTGAFMVHARRSWMNTCSPWSTRTCWAGAARCLGPGTNSGTSPALPRACSAWCWWRSLSWRP